MLKRLWNKHPVVVFVPLFCIFMLGVMALGVAQELREVSFKWSANSEADLMGYTLYAKNVTDNGEYDYLTPVFKINVLDVNDLNAKGFDPADPGCTVGGFDPYKEYEFVARAYDNATDCKNADGTPTIDGHCWSLDSDPVTLAALPEPPPLGPPTNIRKLSYNIVSDIIEMYRNIRYGKTTLDDTEGQGRPGVGLIVAPVERG